MLRTPEPELMEDMEQVTAYASADFSDAEMNSNQESDHTPAPGNSSGDIADVWET